jgi:hypothetical protein
MLLRQCTQKAFSVSHRGDSVKVPWDLACWPFSGGFDLERKPVFIYLLTNDSPPKH